MLNFDINVTWSGGGAVRCPSVPIPSGASVEVRPIADNTRTVYVGKSPNEAQNGPRASFSPTSGASIYNVGNLHELWIYGQLTGEGVILSVRQTGSGVHRASVGIILTRPTRLGRS